VRGHPTLEFFMPPVVSPTYHSEKEAAAYLSVSLSTMRRWRRAKTGPAHFRLGGVLRYGRSALDEFIASFTNNAA
jgi:excisionase family DNA binding protein